MKNVSIRLENELVTMLSEISQRPTTAAQTSIEVLLYLRRATIYELKGLFSREEIIALVHIYNGLVPVWKTMCNPSVLIVQIEDAEKYKNSTTSYGANPSELIDKIRTLTAAQAAILQLELWIFWNNDEGKGPNIERLVSLLS